MSSTRSTSIKESYSKMPLSTLEKSEVTPVARLDLPGTDSANIKLMIRKQYPQAIQTQRQQTQNLYSPLLQSQQTQQQQSKQSSLSSVPSLPTSRNNNNRLLDVENGFNAMSTVTACRLERKTAIHSAHFWKMLSDVRNRSLNRAKLKQSSQVSALLSGFALVGMVEMDVPKTTPFYLILFFIVVTTALVSVHMIALMISTCILPHIESINEMEERASSTKYYDYMSSNTTNHRSNIANTSTDDCDEPSRSVSLGTCRNDSSRSSHEKMAFYITIAWSCSTVIGIFLFIMELAVIVWVKFYDTPGGTTIALVSSLMLVPVLVALIFFAFHFYKKLVAIRYEFTEKVMNDVNLLADELA